MAGGFKPPIPREIRVQILKRVKEEGVPVQQAAQEHGVSPRTVYDWLARQTSGDSNGELQRLRRENQELYELLGRITAEMERWKKKNGHN